MTVCSKCGVELKQGAKFCKACGSGQQKAEKQSDKKARVLAAEKKSSKAYVAIGVIAIAVAAGLFFASPGRRTLDGAMGTGAPQSGTTSYTNVMAENGSVSIPVSELRGSEARFFLYSADGKDIKFFVLRASDGTIRVALDACNACYRAKLGYYQKGDVMVCRNCGLSFRSADIGIVTGGCNPIPLDKKEQGQLIVLKAKDLEDGARFF